jgi:hypothetical protein
MDHHALRLWPGLVACFVSRVCLWGYQRERWGRQWRLQAVPGVAAALPPVAAALAPSCVSLPLLALTAALPLPLSCSVVPAVC